MTLQQALERRRSVRHYVDSPIDADTVRQCLRLAQLAPSSSNMQLYEFYHITDAAVLKQLAEACLGPKAAATAPQMVVFVTRARFRARQHPTQQPAGKTGQTHSGGRRLPQQAHALCVCPLLRPARRVPHNAGLEHRPVPPDDA